MDPERNHKDENYFLVFFSTFIFILITALRQYVPNSSREQERDAEEFVIHMLDSASFQHEFLHLDSQCPWLRERNFWESMESQD